MSKILVATLLLAISFAQQALRAQSPSLTFDVASIRPAQQITPAMVQAGKLHVGMKIDAARVDIGFWTLLQVICEAYKLKAYQVSGPDWLKSLQAQRFDIVATMPPGATKEQVPRMLQALLADRFKLAVHPDSKEATVYALVVAKGGPKFKESVPLPAPADDDAAKNSSGSSSISVKQDGKGATMSTGTGETQKMSMAPDGKSMRLEISNVTMAKLAEGLAPMLDLPLVDMTELKGRYDVALDVSMQDMMSMARKAGAAVPGPAQGAAAAGRPAEAVEDPGAGSIFTAIQALGMKLDKRKLPLTGIAVDRVEKSPTEN